MAFAFATTHGRALHVLSEGAFLVVEITATASMACASARTVILDLLANSRPA
jgi:hypothetical protein